MKMIRVTARALLFLICLAAAMSAALPSALAAAPTYDASEAYKSGKYYENLRAVELCGDGARDTLAIALSQLGYHEGSDDTGLDGLSPDGNRDFVEYNVLYGKLDNDQGNGLSYGYYWCASFVNWCLRQAEVSSAASAAAEVSCHRWLSACIDAGIYNGKEGYIPKSADLVFFKSKSSPLSSSHIGLVLYCDDDRVYTIEGNTSNGSAFSDRGNYVAIKSYPLSSSLIVGYATPKYQKAENIGELDYSGRVRSAGKYISTDGIIVYSDATRSVKVGSIEPYTVFEVERTDGPYLYLSDGNCITAGFARQITASNNICSISYIGITGKRILPTQYAESGERIAVTSEIPKRSDAEFLGWAIEGQDGLVLPDDAVTLSESLELFAVYEDSYRPSEATSGALTDEREESDTRSPTGQSESPTESVAEPTEAFTEQIPSESSFENGSGSTADLPRPALPSAFGCTGALGAGYGLVAASLIAISATTRKRRKK